MSIWREYTNDAVKIVNSTISGNQVTAWGYGGGIFISLNYDLGAGLPVTITNSTISGNKAGNGGGIYNQFYGANYVNAYRASIYNTIIAGNTNLSDAPNDVDGTQADSTSAHNLIGYDPNGLFPSGNGNLRGTSSALDADLGSLAFNGGTTKTHALLDDSVAINAGDNDLAYDAQLEFDQRGRSFIRMVDTVDIGAFEYERILAEGAFAFGSSLDDADALLPDSSARLEMPVREYLAIELVLPKVNQIGRETQFSLERSLTISHIEKGLLTALERGSDRISGDSVDLASTEIAEFKFSDLADEYFHELGMRLTVKFSPSILAQPG